MKSAGQSRPIIKSEAQVTKTRAIIEALKKHYPDAHCELNFQTPFQLLIATILSAQCTDVRVNMVTPALFKLYPDAETMSRAPLEKLEELIKSTGFFRSKAKSLSSCARDIVDKYQGQLPQNLDDMIELRGVGRKTANVVLGVAFNQASGVVVDTHVARLSARLGFSKAKTPEKIEQDLMRLVDKKDWVQLSHLLIWHGRRLCKARKPDCAQCFLNRSCLFYAEASRKIKKS